MRIIILYAFVLAAALSTFAVTSVFNLSGGFNIVLGLESLSVAGGFGIIFGSTTNF